MIDYKLGEVEMQFATIIWDNEPLTSRALVGLAEQHLNWNKSTTYTILRRICERGIFQNEHSVVTSCITKEEFLAGQSEKFVEETFSGSLPQFLAAFTQKKKLSDKEIADIQALIDAQKEG
ncbi:BlaI/MecI/CopY family transcriptional regulator [Bengtsoniella intestinalis]|uniref:BlaI/MecI/CopY family transcriptional regulator n=1 Tax=Bengtsoniella intestinalis TaxID=3073143 RepID=UPI00391F517A